MIAASPWSLVLRAAPWVALAVAGIALWGMAGRLDAASLKLCGAEALLAQKEADARLSADLVRRQAERLAGLERQTALSLQQPISAGGAASLTSTASTISLIAQRPAAAAVPLVVDDPVNARRAVEVCRRHEAHTGTATRVFGIGGRSFVTNG